MGRNAFLLIIYCLLYNCANYGQLQLIAKLPEKLDENSGIIHLKGETVWFIQDAGNQDKLYQVDFNGKLRNELQVKNGDNIDWEDLTKDDQDNVYIGDFGNNHGKRTALVIYRVPNPEVEKGKKIKAEQIVYRYPEQEQIKAGTPDLTYDAEALFYRDNFLYIITKDRNVPFTGEARIYKVPAKKGKYTASFVGNFNTCDQMDSCKVTAAAIAPDGKKVVLLGNGKLWIFSNFEGDDFSSGSMKTIDLEVTTQLEAVCFLDNKTLLLSDEARAGTGRNLYRFVLEK
tara:strand:+ start:1160 stop:2017 length:858 start_codon:yes stop_codon:yes gene_type:complete